MVLGGYVWGNIIERKKAACSNGQNKRLRGAMYSVLTISLALYRQYAVAVVVLADCRQQIPIQP
jgi:hypothetical protein